MKPRHPVDAPWTVVIHHNGEPVTGQLPITRWQTAGLIAPIVRGWIGGTVSVMAAAVDPPEPDPQPTLFEENP